MLSRTRNSFRQGEKLAKKVRTPETAEPPGTRQRVSEIFKNLRSRKQFPLRCERSPNYTVSDIFPELPEDTVKPANTKGIRKSPLLDAFNFGHVSCMRINQISGCLLHLDKHSKSTIRKAEDSSRSLWLCLPVVVAELV
jgi:hypothetical protein